MSNLRVPGRGPLVGHTTTTTCRIWIRAGDPEDDGALLDENRRTIGVIAVVREADKEIPPPRRRVYYFRLHREFDRTGTFDLGADSSLGTVNPSDILIPDTDYVLRVGTLTVDDPFPNDESVSDETLARRLPRPDEANWFEELLKLAPEARKRVFALFPSKPERSLSCWVPAVTRVYFGRSKRRIRFSDRFGKRHEEMGPPYPGNQPSAELLDLSDGWRPDLRGYALTSMFRWRVPTLLRSFKSAILRLLAPETCAPYFGKYRII